MKDHTNKAKPNSLRRVIILIATILTALAVAVACALCLDVSAPVSVDNVVGEAETSTSYTNKTGNLTGAGVIKNGDILDYTTVGQVSVTLPKGTYTLSVWGAQGGTNGSVTGGNGGYATGTYTITAASQLLYIYVGGQNGTNGGGSGTYVGGGATHISTGSGAINSSTARSGMKIAAGGGGGAGAVTGGKGGGGGGQNGVAGTASSWAKGGGAGTTSGAGGGGSPYSGCTAGTSGTTGTGGNGGTPTRGGGGGGGWYGGGGGGGDISGTSGCGGGGGGGGSGYIGGVTGASYSSASRSGNGMARITVVQVNQAPVSQGYTYSSTASNYYRGTARGISIVSYNLAKDNDYSNTSGATVNSVYFTNGTSTNYDTLPAANNGLYLNSACSTLATAYLSWSWTNNQTLSITEIKKYPRNGVDGCSLDGRLTLYTRVRDAFGSSTTRGVSVATFYLQVNDRPITAVTDSFKRVTRSANGGNYEYRIGNSTSTNTSINYLETNSTQIYNPNGTNVRTVFLPKPIAPTDTAGYTIYASDLYSDADTSYDKVGFKTVTAQSGYTQYANYYTIAYNADSTYASGIVPSITVKPSSLRPNGAVYVVATITAQTSETASKVGIGSNNTTFQLVFRLANTRPYFASSTAISSSNLTEPYIELESGGAAKTLNIANMIKDLDDGNNLNAYFSGDVKVPAKEYVQVDASNVAVALATTSNYYNKTTVNTTAGQLSSATGEGNTATGFSSTVIAATGSSAAANAAVTYSFDSNKVIRFTPRAATQYMYSQSGRKGDFYIMVRVVDPSDASDAGIWFPIAIRVKSAKPTETPTVANFTLDFNDTFKPGSAVTPSSVGADAIQGTPNSVILTPISYVDASGVVRGIGTVDQSFNDNSKHVQPFTVDPDAYMYANNSYNERSRALNDIVMLNGSTVSQFVNAYQTSAFFDIERVDLYANRNVFSKLSMTAAQLTTFGVRTYKNSDGTDNTAGYTFYGLKITPKRSTNGEYYQFNVNVKDSHDSTNTVRVCISVANRAVQARRSGYAGGDAIQSPYPINVGTVGSYIYNANINAVAVNYTIERNDVIQITPYDLAYDFDIDIDNTVMNPMNNGVTDFNTNPANKNFPTVSSFLNQKYSVPHTGSLSNPATAASQVPIQTLSFANKENFAANAEQYSGYISATIEDNCTVGGSTYAVPCIRIIGLSRTTSAVVQLRFTITDGYSSLDCVVTVIVNNSAPVLNTEANNPKQNDDDKRVTDPYIMSTVAGMYPTAREFTAYELAYDKDGDTPVFIASSARIVAKVGDKYYEKLDASYKGVESGAAAYTLSDYVNAIFTKNGSGEDVVQITALSSTEMFPTPIYLEVRVQDGFRAQPKDATLRILIDVKNADPMFVPEGLLFVGADEGGNGSDRYEWQIGYENKSETRIARYIFNSQELFDANPVNASPANKVCLFDDSDGMQQVMLDPAEWYTGSTNHLDKLVRSVDGEITENSFSGDGINSAIIYNAMYPNDDGDYENRFLNVSVIFFARVVDDKGNVTFTKLEGTDSRILTTEYWAISISDKDKSKTTSTGTHIAIAVKDNHHGNTVYSSDKSTSKTGQASFKVLNLYYTYKVPGLTAMHSYYRTDGNVEAGLKISEDGKPDVWAVDYNGFDAADKSYQFVGAVPTNQEELQKATFAEDFKYQYFEKTLARVGEGNNTETEITYKCYPNEKSAFYYKPIVVTSDVTSGETIVPISYIAMPKGVDDKGTDQQSQLHVTFANATAHSSLQGNKLFDEQYAEWGKTKTTLDYVFENVTLSDSDGGSWSGATLNENPYITIGYVATPASYINSAYLNTSRYTLEATGDSNKINRKTIVSIKDGKSIYREDKYGFSFKKKDGGKRARNLLKLTVALKTTANSVTDSDVEYVDVEINLANAKPKLSYTDGVITSEVMGHISTINVNMTTSETEGKILALNKKGQTPTGNYRIIYDDPDSNDTMKFLMSSATAYTDVDGNIVGGMSEAERTYITEMTNTHRQSEAFKVYYGVNEAANITVGEETMTLDEYKAQYVANPGYNLFFDVSPNEGRASSVQFIPKAKTQLSIPSGTSAADRKEILDKYHLQEDGNGIYYPFRILFYDDVDGSAFTDGSWASAIVKVYINNDNMRVNTDVIKATDMYPGTPYHNAPNYKFKLSKGTDFFVDVSSLLIDNDIILSGASFAVSDEDYSDFEKLASDYLVLPESYVRISPSGDGELPITVGKPDENSGMSATTIKFSAEAAFKGTVNLAYTFADSVQKITGNDSASNVTIVFSVSYNNEAPTANGDTFGGSESLSITMRTGDSFTLYAADYNKFNADIKGGFNSWTGENTGYVAGYTTGKAEDLYHSFVFNSAEQDVQNGDLGALVIGSDDAASTLRISDYTKFTNADLTVNPAHSSMFKVTPGKSFTAEYSPAGGAGFPMSVTVQALGVVDTTYAVTLIDGEKATVTVYINISVVSTAPVSKQNQLPKDLKIVLDEDGKVVPNIYDIELKYGESKEFDLGGDYGFMSDIDIDDVHSLSIYKNIDNTSFSINNPQGVSAISVDTKSDLSVNSIVITAIDFIPQEDMYSSVSFRIVDRHGAVSEFITIRVKIAPQEMSVIATQQKNQDFALKSYAAYLEDGESVIVDLVSYGADAVVFSDPDVHAASARYNVSVYALLEANNDGTFSPIQYNNSSFAENKSNYLLVSVSGTGINPGYGAVAEYVRRFFDVMLSVDGKTMEFIPNSATIASGNSAELDKIHLYIEICKLYEHGDELTMGTKAAFANVSVANSTLVAVNESPFNAGYPMVPVGEDEMRLRDSSFLEFTGTAGDSLTWNLYDTKNNEIGLFYDYDLNNNPRNEVDGINIGGRESITYVKYELRGINETVKGKGDVLSVTPIGNGKQLTIKINRKVFTGQPPASGNLVSYTEVLVDIYCADTIGYRSGINNKNNLVKTTITVRVENDIPEIKEITDSATISQLGYSLVHSVTDGYVLNARLERGKKLDIKIEDIIDDVDIAMDSYVMLYTGTENSLVTSDGTLMGATSLDGTVGEYGVIKTGGETLFQVTTTTGSNSYAVSTLDKITFTCVSASRGKVGKCEVRFRDSVQSAVTQILTINITVDNIAPKLKPNAETHITLMGLSKNATNEQVSNAVKSFSILDYIVDENGDNYLASDPAYAERTPTYAFIDAILVYDTSESAADAPVLYGPNLLAYSEDKGDYYQTTSTLCYVDWAPSDPNHQTFSITQFAGVYGEQKITFTVVDSGYEEGSSAGVLDGKMFSMNIYVTVANPLEDVADVLDTQNIAYGVTKSITVEDLLGEENARGYSIASIVEADGGHRLGIFAPGEKQTFTSATDNGIDEWRIHARTEGVTVNTTVTFKAGDATVVRTLPIAIAANMPPVYKTDSTGVDKTTYEYNVNMLTDPIARTLKIYPEDWFTDTDPGDVMSFISPVVSSQSIIVEVMLDQDTVAEGGRSFILVKFNRRGSSDITLNLSDSSGRLYEHTITVVCNDAPELSWWENIMSLIEANWMWFWIIVGCALLFIILLIIIIVVVHKKRKMRREIEALLNAEIELEEEMMRLGAGGPAPYQSFGYLPPTQPTVNDPGLMIGGSPNNPTPNNLQLNAGGGAPQQNNVPPAGGGNGDGFDPDEF